MRFFKNVTVYVGGKGLQKRNVYFGEKIEKITRFAWRKADEISLPDDAIVLPGFIDQHIHGAGGSDAMDGTIADLKIIAEAIAREGTTGFLATTMTQSKGNILKALSAVKEYRGEEQSGARLLGVHLEGPFISEKYRGAQPLEYIALPDVDVFKEYNEASGDAIKIVTLAPELEGAKPLVEYLTEVGITASIGHSDAGYESIADAYGLFVKELLKFNDLSEVERLFPGTVVYLQAKKKMAAKGLEMHILEKGETLWQLAQRYAVKMKHIYKLNGWKDDYVPREGESVKLRK